jgi:release factor glutamine methyltransferase
VSRAISESSWLAALGAAASALEAAGIESARQDAEWLLAAVLGLDRFRLYLDSGRELDPEDAARYRALVARRAAREPLQHLLGYEDFDGLRLTVTADVLVPRPETEGLAEWAVAALRGRPDAVVVDVGTGSGAIACAMARRMPALRVLAVERSPAAAALAVQNVRTHGVDRRVAVVIGDLLSPIAWASARLDMVVANPPYIASSAVDALPPEVARFEPRMALDGGPDGMGPARRIADAAILALRPGGWLMMEMAPEQARALAEAMEAAGYGDIEVRRDLTGRARYIAGRRRVEGSAERRMG